MGYTTYTGSVSTYTSGYLPSYTSGYSPIYTSGYLPSYSGGYFYGDTNFGGGYPIYLSASPGYSPASTPAATYSPSGSSYSRGYTYARS